MSTNWADMADDDVTSTTTTITTKDDQEPVGPESVAVSVTENPETPATDIDQELAEIQNAIDKLQKNICTKDITELDENSKETPPIDFDKSECNNNTGTLQCDRWHHVKTKREPMSPHVPLKKELHHILNCFMLKDKHPNSLHISERFKDPRYNNLKDYMHTIRREVVSVQDIRKSIGRLDEPISRECTERFRQLQGLLGNIADRIGNVVDK